VFGTHDLGVFIVAAAVLVMMPGPDVIYILGRSVTQGRKAGVVSGLGVGTGAGVHVIAAALGLSAFLATSANAFTVIKWACVAYLVYLGVRTFLDRSGMAALKDSGSAGVKHRSGWTLYWQGVLTDVLNPKVALFFLAFLPQFIDPAAPNKVLAFLFLGGIVVAIGLTWDISMALFASYVTKVLRGNGGFSRIANRVMGVVLVGLGIRLAQQEM
jgi:threonine/homoserine/homoserine lactone efflux protein